MIFCEGANRKLLSYNTDDKRKPYLLSPPPPTAHTYDRKRERKPPLRDLLAAAHGQHGDGDAEGREYVSVGLHRGLGALLRRIGHLLRVS